MQLANFSHPLLQQRTIGAWQTNCNNFLTYGRKDNILSRLKMFFLFRGTHGVIIVYDVSAGERFVIFFYYYWKCDYPMKPNVRLLVVERITSLLNPHVPPLFGWSIMIW